MPKIRRYFPVTHDINSDPEMWELRDTLGDRAGFVWLEWLAIADRNEGRVGPNSDSTLVATSSKCRTTKAKVSSVRDYAQLKGWINLGADILIAKFWEYHRRREPIKNPHGNSTGSLFPSEPSEPPNLKDPAPAADLLKKKRREISPEIKMALAKLMAIDRKKTERLPDWIERARKDGMPDHVIVASLQNFAPYARDTSEWWPYLNTIAKKEFGRFNEAASSRFKAEERESLGLSSISNRRAVGSRQRG